MYAAKVSGRGTYCVFTTALSKAARRWHTLSNEVHGALARGEFAVHYQPQVALTNGEVRGVEALLRWEHPRLGMISPSMFIPLLEERGLIFAVGRWVMETACSDCAAWHAAGHKVRVAVNLSPQQLYKDDIVAVTREALNQARLAPHWLELEVTESLALDASDKILSIMLDLKALGVSLSLDDFGTGWSSLSYLRHFPLDRLKIDGSFVRDMVTDKNTASIVRSILRMASDLGMSCVAEGVETAQQMHHLRGASCDEYQGFLISRAVPADEIGNLLAINGRAQLTPVDKAT